VGSLKGALPRQSWKTEGCSTWAFGPFVLPSAFSLQPIYLSSYRDTFNPQRRRQGQKNPDTSNFPSWLEFSLFF